VDAAFLQISYDGLIEFICPPSSHRYLLQSQVLHRRNGGFQRRVTTYAGFVLRLF
jgi:hypothetical protein